MRRKGYHQRAYGLIGHFAAHFGKEAARSKVLGLSILPAEYQMAHVIKLAKGVGIVVLVGASLPDGIFIKLDPFKARRAENHRPNPAVSHGQGLDPGARTAVVAQHIILRAEGNRSNQEEGGCKE